MKMVRCSMCGIVFDWDVPLADGAWRLTVGPTWKHKDCVAELWFCARCGPSAKERFDKLSEGVLKVEIDEGGACPWEE